MIVRPVVVSLYYVIIISKPPQYAGVLFLDVAPIGLGFIYPSLYKQGARSELFYIIDDLV